MRFPPHTLLLLLAAALLACDAEPPEEPDRAGVDTVRAPASGDRGGRVYERSLVFMTTRADSTLFVPWLITARTQPGGVRRETRGWLGRGGSWDAFFLDRWQSAPTRAPWRVLPRAGMRLIVGPNESLERIVFDEGPRHLEVIVGQALSEWAGQRGESVRIFDGALVLASERVPGIVLDLSRNHPSHGAASGDWALLASGDSLRVVLQSPDPDSALASEGFRAWATVGDEERQWPEVRLEWSETRPFERARRPVPVSWTATTPDGSMGLDLEVTSAHVESVEGPGPQLPVEAVFGVGGTLRLGEAEYPVRGLFRHVQR